VREPPDPGEDNQPDDGSEDPQGSIRPTSATVVTAWGVAGMVGGWVLHPFAEQVNGTAPVVSWAQPAALLLLALTVGVTAWHTWRSVQVRRERLEPHRAVNRLVLGRAAALVGAFVAGGYLGYAVSWIGVDAELAGQRILRSLVAVVAGVLLVVGGLLLERACRVRSDRPEA
jgi:sulfite exporter TauE/SafE